jgi:hypothetical protein
MKKPEELIPFDYNAYLTGEYDCYTRNGKDKMDIVKLRPDYDPSDKLPESDETYPIKAVSLTCLFTNEESDIHGHMHCETFTINGNIYASSESEFDLMLCKKEKKVTPKLTFSDDFEPGFMNVYLTTAPSGKFRLTGSKFHSTYESAIEGVNKSSSSTYKHLTTIQLQMYPDIQALLVEKGLIKTTLK